MNTRLLLRGILAALLIVVVLAPVTAGAQATRKVCTDTETEIKDLAEPGSWIPSAGPVAHLRGEVKYYDEVSSCPEVDGRIRTVMNGNWKTVEITLPDGKKMGVPLGPMWGTGTMTTDALGPDGKPGVWELSWQGWIDVAAGVCYYKGVGHGVSGFVTGLKQTAVADCTSNLVTDVTVTILFPDE